MREKFTKFANKVSTATGSPWAFIAACGLIIGWLLTGPLAGFNDTWQLIINTTTTIVTFLMVFLIQSTQNRDTKAIMLKLDYLLIEHAKKNNKALRAEDLDEDKLQEQIDKVKNT
jgi:low affinity Fe/Cu permease